MSDSLPPEVQDAPKDTELRDFLQLLTCGILLGLGAGICGMLPFMPYTPRISEEKAYFVETDYLTVCSFNIQSLGFLKARDHKALAACLRDFDVVLIQELIAPPHAGTYPNGAPFKPSRTSVEFFDAMSAMGFLFVLSEQDTGAGDKIHTNKTTSEWWVAFYRPRRTVPAADLPKGYLAEQRAGHPTFARVPYAFPFRTSDGKCDFYIKALLTSPYILFWSETAPNQRSGADYCLHTSTDPSTKNRPEAELPISMCAY